MLDWIFKKNRVPDAAAAWQEGAASAGQARAESSADSRVKAGADVDWPARLQAARGDDAALLTLARQRVPLQARLAAVEALTTEAGLKLAEREFRDHDRRVHRVAKQRYGALVAQREGAALAVRLIGAAKALVGEPLLAANRVVELDRAWQALDPALLDATQLAEFTALVSQLTTQMRENADGERAAKRWLAQARQSLDGLRAASAAVAAGAQPRTHLAVAAAQAQLALHAPPAGVAGETLRAAIELALRQAALLDARLAILDEVLQAPVAADAPPGDGTVPNAAAVGADAAAADLAAASDPAVRWRQLMPLDDAALGLATDRRFEQWLAQREQAQQARRAHRREQTRDARSATRNARTESLATVLARAEAALAAGHVAEVHRHLVEVDELMHDGAAVVALRGRIDRLQAEYAQLKGWQHWAGGRARDDLVLQAEALAAATGAGHDSLIVKLSIKQQAEVIGDMRARWKELDRLGGATSRALWHRFDVALKAAYEPVAANLAAQRAAREQNLLARQQLVEALEAIALPEAVADGAAPDWHGPAGALHHFQTEWRKLGPIEHTVPHRDRAALVERMNAAVECIDGPLRAARQAAQDLRQTLIARARALADEAGKGARDRDSVVAVRELQAAWQQQARALPLLRAVESALWSEFKSATDAIFSARDAAISARDAAISARDAEFKAGGVERAALIGRLETLAADATPAELKRALAEVEAQWQRCGAAPRNDATALESRFLAARDTVRRHIAGSGQRKWQTVCDALAAKLALCESLEHGPDMGMTPETVAASWSALTALPPAWDDALRPRAAMPGSAAHATPASTTATDALLLQVELAWNLESPQGLEAARLALKVQAMKQTLESRRAAGGAKSTADECFVDLLGRTGLDALQRERLGKVVAAMRQRGHGTPERT